MKESYQKGVANHLDPESWACNREAVRQALTGAHVGEPLNREIGQIRGADVVWPDGRQHRLLDNARGHRSLRGPRPSARMETLCTEIGRSRLSTSADGAEGPRGESERRQDHDAR